MKQFLQSLSMIDQLQHNGAASSLFKRYFMKQPHFYTFTVLLYIATVLLIDWSAFIQLALALLCLVAVVSYLSNGSPLVCLLSLGFQIRDNVAAPFPTSYSFHYVYYCGHTSSDLFHYSPTRLMLLRFCAISEGGHWPSVLMGYLLEYNRISSKQATSELCYYRSSYFFTS